MGREAGAVVNGHGRGMGRMGWDGGLGVVWGTCWAWPGRAMPGSPCVELRDTIQLFKQSEFVVACRVGTSRAFILDSNGGADVKYKSYADFIL
jgi:hypothetical protein